MESRRTGEGFVARTHSFLNAAFHKSDTSVFKRTDAVIWFLIVTSIVLMAIELLAFDEGGRPVWIDMIDRAILWCFATELLLRVASHKPARLELFEESRRHRIASHILGRVRYLFTPMTILDMLVIFTFLPALRGLRVLRLLRLFRGVRLFRYSNPVLGLIRTFQENAILYLFTFGFLLTVVLLGGASFYLLEAQTNEKVKTLGDGLWWALVTLTTVGYGDITPGTSPLARSIGGAVMVLGMFTLALFAGIVGSTMLRVLLNLRQDQFRMSNYSNHIVICGYEPSARLLIEALLAEIDAKENEVLVFGPGDRPNDLPMEVMWLSGDPSRESELDKARVTHARTVIIVGQRDRTPALSDAATIMIAFTIRSYLKNKAPTETRKRPLYIVAEILDPENVEHVKTAGADEVIETTRLGFSLMAHAAIAPGTGTVIAKVASSEAHSLYTATNPLGKRVHFGELAKMVHEDFQVTILGVRNPRDGGLVLNPEDRQFVEASDEVIYLARGPVMDQ